VKGFVHRAAQNLMTFSAVTLEGTIIHKSGLITGGRSTHSSSKKWDEKDVQGAYSIILS
jgi:chromosome segregation ATPase